MQLKARTFLSMAFLVASGLPLLVFWLWPYSSILDDKLSDVHERHLLMAKSLSTTLELYHRDLVTVVDAFAAEIAEGGGDPGRKIFENLYFRHVCVVDAQTGEVRLSYYADAFACPARVPAARMEMFRSLAARGAVGLSTVAVVPGEKPRIFLVKQVADALVVSAIHTDFFRDLQRRISFGQNGHAVIVDQSGRVLAHPLEEWEQSARDISELAPVQRMIAGESGVARFDSVAQGKEMIAGFASVATAGWGVMVPQPVSELEASARFFDRDVMAILFIGMALALLMAQGFAYYMSRRISFVQEVVQRVSEADGAVPHTPEAKWFGIRELLALEAGVNRLARRISQARKLNQNHNRELELINHALSLEISEREEEERRRQDSENRFRNLFENAPIAIREDDLSGVKSKIDALNIPDPAQFAAFVDENPAFVAECARHIRVIDVNRAAMKLHGFQSKQDMLGGVVRELHPPSLDFLRASLKAIHAGRTSLSQEIVIYAQNEQARNVISTWTVMPGHEKTYRSLLLTFVDITERLKAEDNLRQAQKMEAVGQLTGGIAHDFNNLLTVIGGNAELLDALEDVDRSLTSPIRRAVSRGAELTQRLLAFSRKQPLRPSAINLADLVNDMTKLLEVTVGAGIGLRVTEQAGLWHAHADPGQVENALLNLVLNARDAMPNGGSLLISLRNLRIEDGAKLELSPGDYLELSVTDTGTGMSEQDVAHAFEPFFSTKEVGKGSGLGLSMVFGFARQSGGDAVIKSVVGQGTRVTLYLPRSETEPPAAAREQSPRLAFTGRGEKILVLEDDHDVRDYFVKFLHAQGYRTVEAPDAATARDMLSRHADIALILSDVRLPGGCSGPEFARSIERQYPDLKVIFVSGYPPQEIRQEIEDIADAMFLSKPFDTQLLLSFIEQSLKKP